MAWPKADSPKRCAIKPGDRGGEFPRSTLSRPPWPWPGIPPSKVLLAGETGGRRREFLPSISRSCPARTGAEVMHELQRLTPEMRKRLFQTFSQYAASSSLGGGTAS
jgi:hypothetical protein